MAFFDFLDSFWNMYVGREDIERVWNGYVSSVGYMYTHLYEVNLGKSIEYTPVTITDMYVVHNFTDTIESPDPTTYPEAYAISSDIVDIPLLTDNYDNPSTVLFPIEDYIVYPNSGVIAFKSTPTTAVLWAAELRIDPGMIEDTFGDLIDFTNDGISSFKYLRRVQGVWLALWGGPQIANEEMGAHIVSDAPFFYDDGIVTAITYDTDPSSLFGGTVSDSNGFEYQWAKNVALRVAVGDPVKKFDLISEAVWVDDYIRNPHWYQRGPNYPVVPYAQYNETYWEIRKYNHFAVWVDMNHLWASDDQDALGNIIKFMDKIKPSHTDYTIEAFLDIWEEVEVPDDAFYYFKYNSKSEHMLDMCLVYNDPRNVTYGLSVVKQVNYYYAEDPGDPLYYLAGGDIVPLYYNVESSLERIESYQTQEYVDIDTVEAIVDVGATVMLADTDLWAYEAGSVYPVGHPEAGEPRVHVRADQGTVYEVEDYPWNYICNSESRSMEVESRKVDDMSEILDMLETPDAINKTILYKNDIIGTAKVFLGHPKEMDICYDSESGKVVICYRENTAPNRGMAVVAVASRTDIRFGTPTAFCSSTADHISCCFDSTNNKVVVVYGEGADPFYSYAVVGTVFSHWDISFGTATLIDSDHTMNSDCCFDSDNGKVVVVCYNMVGSVIAIVGTVSGITIDFGIKTTLSILSTVSIGCCFDSYNNRVVVIFNNTVFVGTVTGTAISFGSYVETDSPTPLNPSCCFDSVNNKVVIEYADGANSNYATAVVGMVSVIDSSISFGTPVVIHSSFTRYGHCCFNSDNGTVTIVFKGDINYSYGLGIVIIGTVSGTSITFGTPYAFTTDEPYPMVCVFNPSIGLNLLAYGNYDSSYDGTVLVYAKGTPIP